MNPIAQAIHDVAEGHVQRVCRPSKWIVFHDGELVYLENIEMDAEPVVITTLTERAEG